MITIIMRRLFAVVLFSPIAFVGCASAPANITASTTAVRLPGAQVAPSAVPAGGTDKRAADYKIGAGDMLDITVYNNSDLTRSVRVEDNGYITLPLGGPIRVTGLTKSQAETQIATQLRGFLMNPQVSITVE